jgi:hypothetical protein
LRWDLAQDGAEATCNAALTGKESYPEADARLELLHHTTGGLEQRIADQGPARDGTLSVWIAKAHTQGLIDQQRERWTQLIEPDRH